MHPRFPAGTAPRLPRGVVVLPVGASADPRVTVSARLTGPAGVVVGECRVGRTAVVPGEGLLLLSVSGVVLDVIGTVQHDGALSVVATLQTDDADDARGEDPERQACSTVVGRGAVAYLDLTVIDGAGRAIEAVVEVENRLRPPRR